MDLKTTAAELNAQADQLEADAKKLREAASILAKTNGAVKMVKKATVRRRGKGKAAGGKRVAPRLRTLLKFVGEHGPMRRTDILAQSGLPEGTVSYLLKAKNGFAKDENGKWTVAEGHQ